MFSMDGDWRGRPQDRRQLSSSWPRPRARWEWPDPWDPHNEWGPGNTCVKTSLQGQIRLNDLHLAVCERVAEKTGWVVKTNPYEGGSDHSEFGRAGIPAVLNWHFTDRYYHSNYDTADKTSPEEMRNVGVSVAASAWLLASAGESTSIAVANLVAQAGQARIALEEREGQKLADAAPDPAAAKAREATIVQAWRKWYGEAVRSVSRLVVGQPTPAFAKTLEDLATGVENRLRESISDLEALVLASDRLRAERWYPPVPGRAAPTPDEVLLQQGGARHRRAMRVFEPERFDALVGGSKRGR